jgi:hypothetical protein
MAALVGSFGDEEFIDIGQMEPLGNLLGNFAAAGLKFTIDGNNLITHNALPFIIYLVLFPLYFTAEKLSSNRQEQDGQHFIQMIFASMENPPQK